MWHTLKTMNFKKEEKKTKHQKSVNHDLTVVVNYFSKRVIPAADWLTVQRLSMRNSFEGKSRENTVKGIPSKFICFLLTRYIMTLFLCYLSSDRINLCLKIPGSVSIKSDSFFFPDIDGNPYCVFISKHIYGLYGIAV